MADFATESVNRVTQPAGTIGGNAPPTPPETQEIKSADPASKAPATTDAHPNASSTPGLTTASEPVKDSGETGTTAPLAPERATEPTVKVAEHQAEQLSAQPDKPDESVSNSAPNNAEGSAAETSTVDDHAKQASPKPVSVEDVQDAEGTTSKPALVNDAAKPETSATNTAPSVSQENNSADKTDAQPTVTDGVTKPEPVPAVSEPTPAEPKTGAKRKAEDPVTLNGEAGSKDTEAVERPEKKQKSSPLKKVVDKVSSAVKKGGRPKKDKKEPAPVGRTARVTRSQAKN